MGVNRRTIPQGTHNISIRVTQIGLRTHISEARHREFARAGAKQNSILAVQNEHFSSGFCAISIERPETLGDSHGDQGRTLPGMQRAREVIWETNSMY
jgi:hypothetical protein